MRSYTRFVQALAACILTVAWVSSAFGQRGDARRVADAGRRQAAPNPRAQQPGAPDWFPLEPRLQKHTDKVLKFWQFHSGKIERYRCNFQRWEYDKTFHPKKFVTFARGKIQYAKPDKGLFEVTELHQGRKNEVGEVGYVKQQASDFEKWICDGKTVFEFDHRNKRVIERPLPPDLQGQQIVDGPLPFLFGAKAQQIKARYWVRVNPAKSGKDSDQGVFWLEAVPKRRKDAANYEQIDIVIPDDDKFLPKAIILDHRGGSRTAFEFSDREFNWNTNLQMLKFWERAFFNPKTPKGWKRFKEPLAQQPVAPAQPARRVGGQPQRNVPGTRAR